MKHLVGYDGKKGEIIKASITLFAAKGYDAVSVRDIAKAAGVSEAALYKHFKGKEDMALYIFGEILKDYSNRLRQIEKNAAEPVEKLCRIVETTYDLYSEYPAEIRFALLSQYSFWDVVTDDIKPHFIIRRILEEGKEKDDIQRQEVYLGLTVFSGIMLQPLAQYPYFHDVLPDFATLKAKITAVVRKVFK